MGIWVDIRFYALWTPQTNLDHPVIITVCNEVAKVMFLHLSVCPRGGVCLSAGIPPPGSRHPPEQTPPRSRPLQSRHPPPKQASPGSRSLPPKTRHPPSWQLLLRTVRILQECILVDLCVGLCGVSYILTRIGVGVGLRDKFISQIFIKIYKKKCLFKQEKTKVVGF